MERSRQKERWILYIVAVLLCLVLASFWLMCNIYAKYTAEGAGSDEARVAKFSVTESGELMQQIQVDVYPGFSQNYKISVTNNSEVTITYTIEAKNTYGNLPLQFEVLDADGKPVLAQEAEIAAQDNQEHIYQLRISWPTSGTDSGNIDTQSPDYAGKADMIELTLKAVQKD